MSIFPKASKPNIDRMISGTFPPFLIGAVLAPALSVSAFTANNSRALREALVADYPLTKVGIVMFKTDYNRITQPGVVLAVRVPGIYADLANTGDAIVVTNVADGKASQATGVTAAFGSSTARSRTLRPNEQVYVTDFLVKHDAVLMELVTVDTTTLADGQGTRYRAEVNVKLPGLGSMTVDEVKKTIDSIVTDPANASAVQSRTVKLGVTTDEIRTSLGNPTKIVDLGAKQIFVYPDMKIVFMDGKVSDVQ